MKPNVIFPLENAGWPALLLDASTAIVRANAAAVKIFGASLEGDGPLLSAIWSSENGGTPEQFIANWERAPQPGVALKLRVKGGESRAFLVSVCSFAQGGEKNFVLQLLPQGESSETTLARKQKLDCALQMARTVSLDFNNALTSILGHTSLLLGKAEANHPWRRSLMEVEKSAARAAEIANDLAVFSRQEKDARPQPPGNINTVVNRCVDFFRTAHGEKIVWNLQLEKGLFGARFDEAKVQQALTKILENAVEAAGLNGTGKISVHTRNMDLSEPTQDRTVHLAAGAYICVEIADNGAGIDPEILPRIFEPFFTTKGKSHRGLGLALAYGIISNHGGGVAVSGQPGAGASARIYLPAEKQLIRESVGSGENMHGTETILMVDDESLLLTMGETILSEFGYKVLTANSGLDALALLSREDANVDLVVTDLVMPCMSGRELVERIRQLKPATKILCTSGYAMPDGKQSATPYLQKPFTSDELLAKVKNVLASAASVD